MKNTFVILLLVFLEFTSLTALEIRLDTNAMSGLDANSPSVSHGGTNSSIYNLIDGDGGTFWVGYFSLQDRTKAVFSIVLDKDYSVEKLEINRGRLTNIPYVWSKQIKITAYKGKGDGLEAVFAQYFDLDLDPAIQTLTLPSPVSASTWVFETVSVYTNQYVNGGGYLPFVEIGFWNMNSRYTVSDIDSIKKISSERKVSKSLEGLKEMYSFIREFSFEGDPYSYIDKWQKLFVDTENLNIIYKVLDKNGNKELKLHIEMVENTNTGNGGLCFSGKILAGKKGSQLSREELPGRNEMHFHFLEYVELGEWRIDEDGSLWVRIGKGGWKKTKGGIYSFDGTDLEGFYGVQSVDF